jgi:hypothetical protein
MRFEHRGVGRKVSTHRICPKPSALAICVRARRRVGVGDRDQAEWLSRFHARPIVHADYAPAN